MSGNLNLQSQRVVIVTLSSSGTDTYAGTGAPTVAAYSENVLYAFKANHANTGACSININGVGALTIKKVAGGVTTDLADNDIRSGQVCILAYDGTNMQLQSTLGNAGGGGGTPGGSDRQVQFNDSGAFGGDSDFTYTEAGNSRNLKVGPGGIHYYTHSGQMLIGPSATGGGGGEISVTSSSMTLAVGTVWMGGNSGSNNLRLVSSAFPNQTDHVQLNASSASLLRLSSDVSGADGIILELAQIASGGTVAANSARIYSKDVAGSAEMFVKDEAGNETQISPHNHTAPASFIDSPFDVIGYEANAFTALVTYTNKSRQNAGRIDCLLFETFDEINTRLGLTGNAAHVQQDWGAVQAEHVASSEAAHDAWLARKTAWEAVPANESVPFAEVEPAVYVAKPQPQWLTDQLAGRTAFLAARATTATKAATMNAKRTSIGQQVAALRGWKTDADNAVAAWDGQTTAQRFAALKVVLNRFGILSNHLADFIQAQGHDA